MLFNFGANSSYIMYKLWAGINLLGNITAHCHFVVQLILWIKNIRIIITTQQCFLTNLPSNWQYVDDPEWQLLLYITHKYYRLLMLDVNTQCNETVRKDHKMKPCLNNLEYWEASPIFKNEYFLWSLCCLDSYLL